MVHIIFGRGSAYLECLPRGIINALHYLEGSAVWHEALAPSLESRSFHSRSRSSRVQYSMEAQGGESSRSLRQQVLQSTELILKAVDVLQGKESESNSSVSATRPAPTHVHGRGHGSTSSENELMQLFNWNKHGLSTRSRSVGKRKTKFNGQNKGSKKKKLKMWKHTFCCLANKDQR